MRLIWYQNSCYRAEKKSRRMFHIYSPIAQVVINCCNLTVHLTDVFKQKLVSL